MSDKIDSENIIIVNNIKTANLHIQKINNKLNKVSIQTINNTDQIDYITNDISDINTKMNDMNNDLTEIKETINPETGEITVNEIVVNNINITEGTIDDIESTDPDNRIINKKYVDDLIAHSSGDFHPELRVDFLNDRSITTKGTIEIGVDNNFSNPNTILNPDGSISTKTITSNSIEITNGKVYNVDETNNFSIVNKKYVDDHSGGGGNFNPDEQINLNKMDISLTTRGGIEIGVDNNHANSKASISKNGELNIIKGIVSTIDNSNNNSIVNKNYVDNKISSDINTAISPINNSIEAINGNITTINNRFEGMETNETVKSAINDASSAVVSTIMTEAINPINDEITNINSQLSNIVQSYYVQGFTEGTITEKTNDIIFYREIVESITTYKLMEWNDENPSDPKYSKYKTKNVPNNTSCIVQAEGTYIKIGDSGDTQNWIENSFESNNTLILTNEKSMVASGNVLIGPNNDSTKAHILLNKDGNITIYNNLSDVTPSLTINKNGDINNNSITINSINLIPGGSITQIEGNGSIIYTKDKTDTLLSGKADSSALNDIYTKSEINTMFNDYTTTSDLQSTYATKTELNNCTNIYYSNTITSDNNPSYSSEYLLKYYNDTYTLLKYDHTNEEYIIYNDAPIGSICIIGDNDKIIYIKYADENNHQVWNSRKEYIYFVNDIKENNIPSTKDTDFIFVYNTSNLIYTLMKWNGTSYIDYSVFNGSICIINNTKEMFINYSDESNHQVWIKPTGSGFDPTQQLTLTGTPTSLSVSGKSIFNNSIIIDNKEITSTTKETTNTDDMIITTKYYVDANNVGKKETGEIFNSYVGVNKNIASGSYSHAEGYKTTASGNGGAHSEGAETSAIGFASHAGGNSTVADKDAMTAIGKFNIYDENDTTLNDKKLFVVGNGTGEDARSDAFVVKNDGNCYIKGTLSSGSLNSGSVITGLISDNYYETNNNSSYYQSNLTNTVLTDLNYENNNIFYINSNDNSFNAYSVSNDTYNEIYKGDQYNNIINASKGYIYNYNYMAWLENSTEENITTTKLLFINNSSNYTIDIGLDILTNENIYYKGMNITRYSANNDIYLITYIEKEGDNYYLWVKYFDVYLTNGFPTSYVDINISRASDNANMVISDFISDSWKFKLIRLSGVHIFMTMSELVYNNNEVDINNSRCAAIIYNYRNNVGSIQINYLNGIKNGVITINTEQYNLLYYYNNELQNMRYYQYIGYTDLIVLKNINISYDTFINKLAGWQNTTLYANPNNISQLINYTKTQQLVNTQMTPENSYQIVVNNQTIITYTPIKVGVYSKYNNTFIYCGYNEDNTQFKYYIVSIHNTFNNITNFNENVIVNKLLTIQESNKHLNLGYNVSPFIATDYDNLYIMQGHLTSFAEANSGIKLGRDSNIIKGKVIFTNDISQTFPYINNNNSVLSLVNKSKQINLFNSNTSNPAVDDNRAVGISINPYVDDSNSGDVSIKGTLKIIDNKNLIVYGKGTVNNEQESIIIRQYNHTAGSPFTIYSTTNDVELFVNDVNSMLGDPIGIQLQKNNQKINVRGNTVFNDPVSLSSGTITDAASADNDIVNKKYIDDNCVGKKYFDGEFKGEIFNSYSGNEINIASGQYSHAEGFNTTASGDYSHAEGYETTASVVNSHAEGIGTTASGANSHAEGIHTTASGDNSHAEGFDTTASGYSSHAEGKETTTHGNHSHAEGEATTAQGDNSHAEGGNTTAQGDNSHAEGRDTTAVSDYSHAGGWGTIANDNCMTAIGKYNKEIDGLSRLFAVGNGNPIERSDAFVVYETGKVVAQSSLYVGNHLVYASSTKLKDAQSESFISLCDNNQDIYALVNSIDNYIIYKYYNYDARNKLIEISKENYPIINNISMFNNYLLLTTNTGLYNINLLDEELSINQIIEDPNINKIVIDPRNNNYFYILYNSYDYFTKYSINDNTVFIKNDYHIFTNQYGYLSNDLNVIDIKFYNDYIYFIHELSKVDDKYYLLYSNYNETNNTIERIIETNIPLDEGNILVDTYMYQEYIYFLITYNGSINKLFKILRNNINEYNTYENIINDNITKYNQNIYYSYNSNIFYIISNNYIHEYELYSNLLQLNNKLYADGCKYINNNHTIYFTNNEISQINNKSVINGDIMLNGLIKTSTLNATQLNVSDIDVNVNKTITHNTLIDGEINNYHIGEPVFIKGNEIYTLQRKSNEGKYPIYEYIKINKDNYIKNSINQIPMITNESNDYKTFIGIITNIYSANTPLKINEITSNYIKINQDTIDFATHGDYIFKVDDNTALHQTTSGSEKIYEIGDELLYDGRIIDPEQPLLRKYESMIIGKITYIPNDDTRFVSVFKN